MAFPSYSTGLVSVSAGGTVVTGVGTLWAATNVRPGDDIVIDGHTVVVMDFTDSTHLVINPYPGSTVSGAAYQIIQNSPLRYNASQTMMDVSQIVATLNTDGFYFYVSAVETVPNPSYGNEGQYALQATTGKLWLKSGGVWVFMGISRSFRPRGAWNSGADYQIGDVVSFGTSSYIALAPSTNQSPPNATYWMPSGGKGDTGELSIGTVTTGIAGSSAAVANVGTTTDAVFNFTIPRGDKGDRATVTVGTVATLSPGSLATVADVGTSTDGILNFGIPRGDQGVGIQPDATGSSADKSSHDSEPKDFIFLQTDVIPFQIWVKASSASGDWSGPTFIGGELAIGDWGFVYDTAFDAFDFGGL